MMGSISIYELIRSRRKSIALVITKDAKLEVRAPLMTPLSFIESLIERKRDWIGRKQEELRHAPHAAKKSFVNGEEYLFLGKTYRLAIMDDVPSIIELKDSLNLAAPALPLAHEIITAWYKTEAMKIFTERCAFFSAQTGFHPTAIKFTNANTRWGSCSPNGALRFNWRLIMAQLEIIDYLIVHEMAHLKHRNHSHEYWDTVRQILPDYKIRRKWLKDNGNTLVL